MTTFKILSRKTNTIAQFFFTNLLLSNCSLICSSIFSHPLYFSYFIFFSPYFLNLLYFLWPLFVTISLLAVTLSASSSAKDEQKGDVDERDDDDDVYRFVEAEAYRVLFDQGVSYEVEDDKYDDPVEELKFTVFEDVKCSFEEDPVEIITPSSRCIDDNAVLDKICPQDLAKDIDIDEIDEKANHGADEKKVIESSPDLVKVKDIAQLIKIYESNASNNADQCCLGNIKNARSFSTKSAGWKKQDDAKLGSYGSMRVLDKEWKRTLACKLYEERNNVGAGGGDEGMDSLWETDEPDTSKVVPRPATKKNTKKSGIITINENDDGDEDVDGDEEEEIAVQLCCLQALKISSGKMNLGIKKPSLLRFSKALKGLGWLHSANSGSSSKNGKKAVRN